VQLGGRGPIIGKADTTGLNPGNWTIVIDPAIINISTQIQYFEVFKMIVHGAGGSTFDVYVDNLIWDTAVYGQQNSWDPTQPLKMQQGQTLYFMYSDPVSDGIPPRATIWLRYDIGTKELYGK
jgi:hypothetical protein